MNSLKTDDGFIFIQRTEGKLAGPCILDAYMIDIYYLCNNNKHFSSIRRIQGIHHPQTVTYKVVQLL
jgi:hypothetical protein